MTRFLNKRLLFVGIAIVFILFLFGVASIFYFKGYSIRNSEPGLGIWKTYKNVGKYKYQVEYPASWEANPLVALIDDESVGLGPGGASKEGLRVACPMDAFNRKELPEPESVYITDYTGLPICVTRMTLNGMKTVQWIMDDQINTYFLRDGVPLVCDLWSDIEPGTLKTNNCNETIKAQKTYNLILSSFKFTN